ncbi:hypothetical protein ARTHRO9V_20212 [Arthrobacter sp. 9V]|nr:hypothetical protein ARTHRO9V_20212 [Arthrobacter sp. 9V]
MSKGFCLVRGSRKMAHTLYLSATYLSVSQRPIKFSQPAPQRIEYESPTRRRQTVRMTELSRENAYSGLICG